MSIIKWRARRAKPIASRASHSSSVIDFSTSTKPRFSLLQGPMDSVKCLSMAASSVSKLTIRTESTVSSPSSLTKITEIIRENSWHTTCYYICVESPFGACRCPSSPKTLGPVSSPFMGHPVPEPSRAECHRFGLFLATGIIRVGSPDALGASFDASRANDVRITSGHRSLRSSYELHISS